MPFKLYNALSRKKENFKPLKGKTVRFYAWGPAVYAFVHIGNLRTFVFDDLLRRTFELNGYKVKEIMNLTDVDDKTINGAKDSGKTLKNYTSFYEKRFLFDVKALNILPAAKYTRATDHIQEMIKMISTLFKKKVAYKTSDGIYFNISKFKNYGKLSRLNAQDFALWKFKKEGEPSWAAPFGEGRPGWHIECSAMSIKYLGMPLDIHSGGVDLIFPHHENEIAQSEAAYGKKFARFFAEGEHLSIGGKKMAQSLGNIFTLRDIEERGFEPLDFRYLTFTAHYRSPLSFSWESLSASRNARKKLEEKALLAPKSDAKVLKKFKMEFLAALNDDLNIPKALALVWKARGRDEILYADKILGLGLDKVKKVAASAGLEALLREREVMRRDKKWREADLIRDKILKAGYIIEDTPQGARLKRAS